MYNIIIIKYSFCSIMTFPMDKKIMNTCTLIQTINFAHPQKLIIIIMSLLIFCMIVFVVTIMIVFSFNSEAASLLHSESQLLIEHLKRGMGREVNAIETGVSPKV